MAPLHVDLFQQDRCMLNQSELPVELFGNSDAFCLMSFVANTNYHIEVQYMCLYVKKVEVAESINLAYEILLHNTSAKYSLRIIQLTTTTATANR